MKKVFYLLLIIFSIFGIYYKYHFPKINYVSIGNSLLENDYDSYIKDYLGKSHSLRNFNTLFKNNKIDGLMQDIKNNRTIWVKDDEYFLKKTLRESDVLVISIGMEELNNNYDINNINNNYCYFSKMIIKIENLLKEIRKYAQDKILFLGYFNPTNYYDSRTDEFFFDVDYKLSLLMDKYDIIYLPIYETVKSNNYQNSKVFNSQTLQRITKKIIYYL